MNNLGKVANEIYENAIESFDRRAAQTSKTIHVLFVGPGDRGSIIHDALLQTPSFRLSIASDYRELWMIPRLQSVQVVVLHNTFSSSELEEVGRFVRRRWPRAGILVVHRGGDFLDDALYDDRVDPTVTPEILLTTIERLTGKLQDWRSGDVEL
jgi:hypothetical protein